MNNNIDNFNEVEHKPLQAYNRAVMFFNIYEDKGRASAEDYAAQFSTEDRFNMAVVTKLVEKKGVKAVRELVTSGVEFPLYQTTEEVVAGLA